MTSGLGLFPDGAIGAGLLVMRLAIATSLLLLATSGTWGAAWAQFSAVLLASGLLVGFQARALACVSALACFVNGPLNLTIVHALLALSLALTGPGSLSADAYLFGRRTLKLPHRDDTDR